MADNEEVDQNEKERMVRQLKFLYKGRFNDEEARKNFDHVNWDIERGLKFVSESESSEIREIIGQSEDSINAIKTDPNIIDLLKNGIKKATRQFACESCDHAWWRKVPMSKEVSECRKCKKKYDPVPREFEWGLATYHCECGNEFSGSGQKNTTAPCFECERSVYPTRIGPFGRRRVKKSANQHCCDAPDCTGHDPVHIHDIDHDRVYDDGTDNSRPVRSSRPEEVDDVTGQVENLYVRHAPIQNANRQQNYNTRRRRIGISTCVSPESRVNKKRVVYPSEPHISTGSTIATFLSQSDIASSYMPSLASIPEYHGRGGRGRGRGGRRY